jgi:RNA polymerase sigma factor (sigma-70 family)
MYANNVGALPTAKPYKNLNKSDLSKAKQLCTWYSNKLSPNNIDLKNELIQHGMLSFVEVYQKFNADLGYSAITYSAPYVKGEILRYWNKLKSPVKISQTRENLSTMYSLGRDNNYQISENNESLIKNAMSHINLDDLNPDKFYQNEYLSENSLLNMIEKKDELKKLKKTLSQVKKNLNDIEKQILKFRILGEETLSNVANKLGLSIEGVRKKETRIIKLIKLQFEDHANKYNEKYI